MKRGCYQRGRDTIRARREHARYLVVHTGRVTEEEYFDGLRAQLHNGALTLKYGKNLQECVRIAMKEGNKAITQSDSFDEIFIVDDIDGRTAKQIAALCLPLASSGLPVRMIFSNPCFEVWLLCYTGKVGSEAGAAHEAQKLAKKCELVGGAHGKSVKMIPLDHKRAIMTAERLRGTYGEDVATCAPTTDMDLLVGRLLGEIKE